jgi:hypothetical protein
MTFPCWTTGENSALWSCRIRSLCAAPQPRRNNTRHQTLDTVQPGGAPPLRQVDQQRRQPQARLDALSQQSVAAVCRRRGAPPLAGGAAAAVCVPVLRSLLILLVQAWPDGTDR